MTSVRDRQTDTDTVTPLPDRHDRQHRHRDSAVGKKGKRRAKVMKECESEKAEMEIRKYFEKEVVKKGKGQRPSHLVLDQAQRSAQLHITVVRGQQEKIVSNSRSRGTERHQRSRQTGLHHLRHASCPAPQHSLPSAGWRNFAWLQRCCPGTRAPKPERKKNSVFSEGCRAGQG